MTLPAASPPAPTRCWVLSSGAAGMENQGLGLAEALQRRLPGLEITAKHIALRQPWGRLTPYLPWPSLSALSAASDPLAPPWPDLVIGIGRQSIAPALALRAAARRAGQRLWLVQLQKPTAWTGRFDLVVPPAHDRMAPADNLLPSLGALHRVTPDRLTEAITGFADRLADCQSPRYAVLIGGDSRHHRLDPATAGRLADNLSQLAEASSASLLVTASRRTGPEAATILRQRLDRPPHWFWDGNGENPYFAFLGAADAIIVTSDSASMASEAAAAGKPVYRFDLPGGSAKFERFHASLEQRGAVQPLPDRHDGPLAIHACQPLLEADRIAGAVIERFGWG